MKNVVKIDPNQVEEHTVLSSSSLEDLGCSTADCEHPVTHIALVQLKLINGRTLVVTKPYCRLCARILDGTAQA